MDLETINQTLNKLTKHQLKIIQMLYEAGDSWLTRSQLARALGKKRLTPYDIECLNQLKQANLIVISTQPTTAPGSDFAYIYRVPEDVAKSLLAWSESRQSEANLTKRHPIQLQ